MNKLNKKSIFAIIGLVLVLAISLVLPLGTAFADYVEDVQTITNAIVDFNQIQEQSIRSSSIPGLTISQSSNWLVNISGTYTGSNETVYRFYQSYFNLFKNHVYFFKFYSSFNNYDFIMNDNSDIQIKNFGLVSSDLFTPSYDIIGYIGFKFITNNTYNTSVGFSIIDLTQMFGENNDNLTLDQANELFVADFYPYNQGTPVAYDTIDAYNNGVNAYLNSTEYVISSLGFLNSVYAVTLNNEYTAQESQITRDSVNNCVVVEPFASNVTPTLCLPFNYTIPTGTQITISGSCATTQYNASYRLYFGLWGNGGEMITIPQSMVAGTQGYLSPSTITFTLPMSVDRIYIMTSDDATWYLSNFEVGYYLTNVDTLRELGYADGVKYMQDQYAPNGALYQSIYMKGYNAYPTEDHFTFQKLIASSIDVPVQAFTNLFDYDILGVNMKTFYLSLFTLAVIVTIIRLVL